MNLFCNHSVISSSETVRCLTEHFRRSGRKVLRYSDKLRWFPSTSEDDERITKIRNDDCMFDCWFVFVLQLVHSCISATVRLKCSLDQTRYSELWNNYQLRRLPRTSLQSASRSRLREWVCLITNESKTINISPLRDMKTFSHILFRYL